MGTRALRITDGAKSFQHDTRHEQTPLVLSAINLEVAEGEIFALLGPSGCGKSTLLRAIAGLDRLTSGEVEITHSASSLGRSASVGMVFQEPLLLPWLTVAENIAQGLHYRANRGQAGRVSIEPLLNDFGLAELAHAYPGQLSGGQAQRVSLARALAIQPAVLLLDEPFAALDPPTRTALQDWLLEVARQRHLTIVIVTHDLDEALYLGDRIGLMSRAPGTISHIWTVAPAGETDRYQRRSGVATLPLRQAILAHYQTNLPAEAAQPSWVI